MKRWKSRPPPPPPPPQEEMKFTITTNLSKTTGLLIGAGNPQFPLID